MLLHASHFTNLVVAQEKKRIHKTKLFIEGEEKTNKHIKVKVNTDPILPIFKGPVFMSTF